MALRTSNGHNLISVWFGFKAKKLNQTVGIKQNQTKSFMNSQAILTKPFNPNYLGKSCNQIEPFTKNFKLNHLSQTN